LALPLHGGGPDPPDVFRQAEYRVNAVFAAACVKFSKIDQGVGYCSSAKIDILLFDRQNHPSVPT